MNPLPILENQYHAFVVQLLFLAATVLIAYINLNKNQARELKKQRDIFEEKLSAQKELYEEKLSNLKDLYEMRIDALEIEWRQKLETQKEHYEQLIHKFESDLAKLQAKYEVLTMAQNKQSYNEEQ